MFGDKYYQDTCCMEKCHCDSCLLPIKNRWWVGGWISHKKLYMQIATRRLCNTCNLQYMQFATHAICHN